MRRAIAAGLASASLAAMAPAMGHGQGNISGAMLGEYRFGIETEDGGAPTCVVTLSGFGHYGRLSATADESCLALFPALGPNPFWTFNMEVDGFVLGSEGMPGIVFAARGPDWYVGGIEGDATNTRYTMVKHLPEKVHIAAGPYHYWGGRLKHGTCVVTLVDRYETGQTDAPFALFHTEFSAGCDALPEAARPVGWSSGYYDAEGIVIALVARGGELIGRFVQQEGGEEALAADIGGTTYKLARVGAMPPEQAFRLYSGAWMFADASGASCTLTLGGDVGNPPFTVIRNEGCTTRFTALQPAYRWGAPEGDTLELLTSEGGPALVFKRREDGTLHNLAADGVERFTLTRVRR